MSNFNTPPGAPGPGSPNQGVKKLKGLLGCLGAFAALFAFLVLVALLPDDYEGAGALAIPVGLGGALIAWKMKGVPTKVLVVLITIGFAAGGAMMLTDSATLTFAGWICCGVAIALVPPYAMAVERQGAADVPRPLKGRAMFIAAILGVLAVAFGTAFYGLAQRDNGYFAQQYGVKVNVHTESGTCYKVTSADSFRIECDATWRVNGDTVNGTLNSESSTVDGLVAYALGDHAYTPDYGGKSKFYMLGLAPWWLLIPFPVTLLALLIVNWARQRARRAHASAPRVQDGT